MDTNIRSGILRLGLACGLAGVVGALPAQEETATDAQESAEEGTPEGSAPSFDRIHLKNGSVVLGEIVGLKEGVLTVKSAFAVNETVKVQWKEVEGLETATAHLFVLADDSRLRGVILRTEDAVAVIDGEGIVGEVAFPLESVTAINPPPKKPIELVGSLSFGASIADGNTSSRTATFTGNAVAQSERQRLTFRAAWNYAEDGGGITARNTKGTAKYDFFVTERFFLFASILLEEDEFQDLSLRTAVSGGPGYQFIKKGDYSDWWNRELEFYAEAGVAYFNEDKEVAEDDQYMSGRWSMKLDWPLGETVSFFHYHEGYPGFEDISDLYITTEQGVRFNVFENFVASFQVNWRWDATPSPGFERSDVLYLASLGYRFRL